MECSFVYITAPEVAVAHAIGRTLVEERLAACVNILPGMQSIYHWQGKIDEATEAVLIAKTVTDGVERLTTRVKELHPYECPCVVAWPLTGGNADYMRWLVAEAKPVEAGDRS